MQKFITAAVMAFLVLIIGTTPGVTQDEVDHTSLITEIRPFETGSSEFVVDGAVRIDVERAHELYESGAVFVDVRSTWRYDLAHIRGAVGLELHSQFTKENLAKYVEKNQLVVFYCNHSACDRSAHASAKALMWGYTDVYHFSNGWSAWSGNNYEQD